MIGCAQVVLPHKLLSASVDVGANIRNLFDHLERSMTIEKVSVGVCPPAAYGEPITGTWFRFQGELK